MSLLKRTPWFLCVAVLISIALLAFAACEDDEEEETTPTATATSTVTTTPVATLRPQAQRPTTAQEVQAEVVEATDELIAVQTEDNRYVSNHFRIDAAEPYTFSVSNLGTNPHTFTIAGVDGEFGTADDITTDNISGGDSEDLPVTLNLPGTYVFRCNNHPTEMWGEIEVESP